MSEMANVTRARVVCSWCGKTVKNYGLLARLHLCDWVPTRRV